MLAVAAVALVAGGVGYVALSGPSIVIPDDPCAERPPLRNVPEGCPDRCAPAGLSWHQLGAAIDITQAGLDDPGIISALEDNGWCQSLPGSDPGHFSFDGCH